MQLLRDAAIMALRHEHVVQSVAPWPLLESEFFCKELLCFSPRPTPMVELCTKYCLPLLGLPNDSFSWDIIFVLCGSESVFIVKMAICKLTSVSNFVLLSAVYLVHLHNVPVHFNIHIYRSLGSFLSYR